MSEKLILDKLIKIANNQQKILAKLAQAVDPNLDYLKRAAQVAALNSGFSVTNVEVSGTSAKYNIIVSGAPKDNKTRQKFLDTLIKQVNSQKPELANVLAISLKD